MLQILFLFLFLMWSSSGIYRSWDDFADLWKSVLKSDNYQHLFNLLINVVNQYLRRSDLESWEWTNNNYPQEKNEYKHIKYEHDIANLCKQMIKRVAYRLFYDKRSLEFHLFEKFQTIIKKYMKITKMNGEFKCADDLYTKLVNKFFEAHKEFHPSIILLFNEAYFNDDIFEKQYNEILNDRQREKFLKSVFTVSIENADKFEMVYEYFMRLNQYESFEYIVKCLNNPKCHSENPKSLVPLINTYKNVLDMDEQKILLNELDDVMIDTYLLQKRTKNKDLWSVIFSTCDETIIHHKFEEMSKEKQVAFIKDLFPKSESEKCGEIEVELAKFLMDKHIDIGLEIFDVWFPKLMHQEKEWIVNTFMNVKWLSFAELEIILNVISDSLINDKSDIEVPKEYFDFINKYTNIDM